MAKRSAQIKVRLNLKIDASLRDWVMDYARRHDTTATAVICKCLELLRQEEASTETGFAEQI